LITQIITTISSWALNIIDTIGYNGIFFLSLIESAGIPVPSEIVLPFSGFLSFTGRFNFWVVVVTATLANYAGSVILYYIGKCGGRWILEKYGRYILISNHDLVIGDMWFHRHGAKVTFWGRLLPIVRTFISLPAGVMRMNFKKFSLYTFSGALPWNAALAYVGYITGDNWDILKKYFHIADYVIAILVIFFVILFIYKKKWSKEKN